MKKKKLAIYICFYRGDAQDLGSYSRKAKVDLNTGEIIILESLEESNDSVSFCTLKCNGQRLYPFRNGDSWYINPLDVNLNSSEKD